MACGIPRPRVRSEACFWPSHSNSGSLTLCSWDGTCVLKLQRHCQSHCATVGTPRPIFLSNWKICSFPRQLNKFINVLYKFRSATLTHGAIVLAQRHKSYMRKTNVLLQRHRGYVVRISWINPFIVISSWVYVCLKQIWFNESFQLSLFWWFKCFFQLEILLKDIL